MLAEALAHQVQGERVHAGVGEGQDAGAHAGDEVAQRRVHLAVVVGAVQVDHVTGEPADGEQADEHQHGFRQTLPGLELTGEDTQESGWYKQTALVRAEGATASALGPVSAGAGVLRRGGPRSSGPGCER